MNPQVWWYLSRSSGIIAWVAITLSVLWGLTLSTRLLGRTAPPAWLLDVHRFLGAAAVIFTGVHIFGLVADDYLVFGWSEILVPFSSTYKTKTAVAWGVVAFYLLIAVEISSLTMRRLPKPMWRWVHRSSWLLFVMVTIHGLKAGTDVQNVFFRWTAIISTNLVLFLTLVRVMAQNRASRRNPGSTAAKVPAEAGRS